MLMAEGPGKLDETCAASLLVQPPSLPEVFPPETELASVNGELVLALLIATEAV